MEIHQFNPSTYNAQKLTLDLFFGMILCTEPGKDFFLKKLYLMYHHFKKKIMSLQEF